MPRYAVTITRTRTNVSADTVDVDLPIHDVEFVRRYVEMMMHPEMRHKTNGISPYFSDLGKPAETFEIGVAVAFDPLPGEPDFVEAVEPAPAPVSATAADDEVAF